MSKELVISSNRHETKVAILEDDQLVEIYFQRANEYSLAGSIHKGKVTRVLPGMQSAFVDLGLERDTFLYVSDFFDETEEEIDRLPSDEKPVRRQEPPPARVQPAPVQTQAPAPPEEPSPAEAEPTAGPASIPEKAESNERGDRRGRRGRRRRSRGHGFPESKYASGVGEPAAALPEPVSEEQEVPEEVLLLPGESLAKYKSRPAIAEEPAVEAPRLDPASYSAAATDRESAEVAEFEEARLEAGQVPVDADEARESEPEKPASTRDEKKNSERPKLRWEDSSEATVASAFPEAAYVAPGLAVASPALDLTALDNAVPDAEEHVITDETGPSEISGGGWLAEPDIAETEDIAEAEDVAEAEDEVEAIEAEVDEADEDVETEPAVLERAEVEAEGLPVEEGSDEGTVEETAPAEALSEPRTASVREQGNRYQHRTSRRMRRRGRGSEHRPVPAVVETPAPPEETEVRGAKDKSPLPSITDLLKEGQEIIVQIAKEPLGQKGARITSHIALPGRYVVYMPTLEHLGVSRKIASDEERQRLKKILQAHRSGVTGGFIVRTAGEGRTDEEIGSDMAYLYNLWLDIRQKAEKRPAPLLLHHDLDIVQRILRDQLNDMFKSIWVDNEEVYESILRFMQRFQPALVSRVKLYTRPQHIFDGFNVTQEIEKALRPKVWLKSGGYIVINQTEALVAIDVNTGKYVGKSNRLEDTITKTNTEAVREIARQIRLRDLGGIIVVDFIDMDERKNRQKVMQALEEAMRADRAPYKILQFNDFGLVAITRKRVKQSLERTLCAPCPSCEGAGYVKSVSTVVSEILQEASKLRHVVEGKNVVLRAHPDVAKFLKSSKNSYLEEIEETLGRAVLVTSDPMLQSEKFDLAW